MTQDAHLFKASTMAQPFDTCQGIIGKILGGDIGIHSANRLACRPVIVTQGGNACTSQPVGYYCEGFMFEHLFISVLRTTARHHQEYTFGIGWNGECSRECGSRLIVGKCHFFCFVWIWWLGSLWTTANQ